MEHGKRQTFPSIPARLSLTTVGVSVSRLLRSVVRMRFCGKQEKKKGEVREYLAQGMCV